jgi:hypothetical protein
MGSKKKKSAKKRSREVEDEESMEAGTKKYNETENSWCPEFSTISSIHDTQRLVAGREEHDTVGAASGNIDSRLEVEELEKKKIVGAPALPV